MEIPLHASTKSCSYVMVMIRFIFRILCFLDFLFLFPVHVYTFPPQADCHERWLILIWFFSCKAMCSLVHPLPRSRISCCSPQAPCVSGAPNQVSDDEVPIPCLHVTSPLRPSACATAASPSDSDDEVPIPRFSHCPALVSCYRDAAVPPQRLRFLTFAPPLPLLLFALNLPRMLAAVADDLSGMVNTNLLLLPLK
jgi:hypothetical protein